MQWLEVIIITGLVISVALFVHNISSHMGRYRDGGYGIKIFIVYIEIVKTVGGTFLTLLWIASSLFLYEGITEYFGGRGIFAAVVLIIPICLVFYAILQGFVRLMDAFPEMMHQNNSEHDDHD